MGAWRPSRGNKASRGLERWPPRCRFPYRVSTRTSSTWDGWSLRLSQGQSFERPVILPSSTLGPGSVLWRGMPEQAGPQPLAVVRPDHAAAQGKTGMRSPLMPAQSALFESCAIWAERMANEPWRVGSLRLRLKRSRPPEGIAHKQDVCIGFKLVHPSRYRREANARV